MTGYQVFRFSCLTLLWLIVCYFVVSTQPFTPRVAFIVIASGIVVFVPVWKKYRRNGNKHNNDRH